MVTKAISMPLERNEASPAEFAIAQYVLTAIAGGAFASIGFDLAGGLKAGQYGMVYTMAKTALHNSIRIYLKATGRVVVDPADEEVFELLREADSALAEQAWRLECENPMTDAEVTGVRAPRAGVLRGRAGAEADVTGVQADEQGP